MPRTLTDRMPIIRLKVSIGPVTLRHLENYFANNCEPWPKSVPKEIVVNALVDTGASVSVLDSSIVDQLQLHPRGTCSISGFDSPDSDSGQAKQYPNYEVGLALLGEAADEPLLAIGAGQIVGHRFSHQRFDAMIGMDVLKHCHFQLDGPSDSFEITAPVPSIDEISSVTISGS